MKTVGLTGGIGSGKSTVCKVFAVLGIPVFEADQEAKRLMVEDEALHTALAVRFGREIIGPDGLDRKALADKVFKDPKALEDLNALVHPAVRRAFGDWVALQVAPYVIMEAAILVETGGYKAFDKLIVVTAPETLRIQRVMQRDGAREEDVAARISNQADDAVRLAVADHVVYNDDTRLVIPQVLAIHRTLCA
jgi:dephospho-CoA kinase